MSSRRQDIPDFLPTGKSPIIIGVILVALFLFGSRFFVNIEAGQGGVLFETLGGGVKTDVTYSEGLQFKMPWNDIVKYEVRQQEMAEEMRVLSSNGLDIELTLSGWIRPEYDKLGLLHQEKGPNYQREIVIPALESAARAVVGRYTPEEIYSTKREEMEIEIFREHQQNSCKECDSTSKN